MKLHDGDRVEEVSVWTPKVGRRFHRIELNAEDWSSLSRMSSEQLAAWFQTWALGFISEPLMYYRGVPIVWDAPIENGDQG